MNGLELKNILPEKKKRGPKKKVKEKIVENDSLQYNCQDLDQQQNVDVDPVQLNSQNLHVHIDNDRKDYSSKITGTTYLEDNNAIIRNVDIYLYFGFDRRLPVCKTTSDENGNFKIEDIPPGYYILHAEHRGALRYRSQLIKVLPCQTVSELILLKNFVSRT